MDYPRGLIRYTTENMLKGIPTHILRPRIFIYGGLLLAIFISIGIAVNNRMLVQLDVIRDRNTLFKETDAGWLENVYTLKLMNMDKKSHSYQVTVSGIDGLRLEQDQGKIEVDTGNVLALPVRLLADPSKLSSYSTEVKFKVTAQDDPKLTITTDSRFLGPLTNK
jgi:polyferredoxin